LQSVVTEELQL